MRKNRNSSFRNYLNENKRSSGRRLNETKYFQGDSDYDFTINQESTYNIYISSRSNKKALENAGLDSANDMADFLMDSDIPDYVCTGHTGSEDCIITTSYDFIEEMEDFLKGEGFKFETFYV